MPPPGYNAQGDLVVVESMHKNGRKVIKNDIKRTMETILARSRVAVAEEDPKLKVVFFPETIWKAQTGPGTRLKVSQN